MSPPAASPAAMGLPGDQHQLVQCFPMAPLIRSTLMLLYVALVLPLPLLAPPGLTLSLWLAAAAGLAIILAITSERVELDAHQIRVAHPPWCSWLIRRAWCLRWDEISGITPVTTSQGGRVHYLRSRQGDAFLLPQRVADFDRFLIAFTAYSGITSVAITRLTPPWTYRLLALISAALLVAELLAMLPFSPLRLQPVALY